MVNSNNTCSLFYARGSGRLKEVWNTNLLGLVSEGLCNLRKRERRLTGPCVWWPGPLGGCLGGRLGGPWRPLKKSLPLIRPLFFVVLGVVKDLEPLTLPPGSQAPRIHPGKTSQPPQRKNLGFRVFTLLSNQYWLQGERCRYRACRGWYRPHGCAEAGPARSVSPRVSGGIGAAHHRRWAAYALSLGLRV